MIAGQMDILSAARKNKIHFPMRKTFIILLFVCAFSLVTRAEETFTASSSHPNPLQRHIEAVAEAFYKYAIRNWELDQLPVGTQSDSDSITKETCSCYLHFFYSVDNNGTEVVTISRDPLKRQECRYSFQSAQSIQTDQSGESTYEMVSRLYFRMDEFMILLSRREDNDGVSIHYMFTGQGQKKL